MVKMLTGQINYGIDGYILNSMSLVKIKLLGVNFKNKVAQCHKLKSILKLIFETITSSEMDPYPPRHLTQHN